MSRQRRHRPPTAMAQALLAALISAGGAADAAPSPNHVRVLASQYHSSCPIGTSQRRTVLSIDSPREWDSVVPASTALDATGRKVRWSREQVLLYAPAPGRQELLLSSPAKGLLLSSGVLYWPVDEQVAPQPQRKGVRPCLISVVTRAYWQRIKIVDPKLMRHRPAAAR